MARDRSAWAQWNWLRRSAVGLRNATRRKGYGERGWGRGKAETYVSWFSRCRAGLAGTNGDEEPRACPPHASMVSDRKLLLLLLVNPRSLPPPSPFAFSPLPSPLHFFFPPVNLSGLVFTSCYRHTDQRIHLYTPIPLLREFQIGKSREESEIFSRGKLSFRDHVLT